MSNGIQIDEEQFMEMDEKNQHLILYRNQVRLEKKVARKGKIDTAITAGTGFLGGLIAVIGKSWLIKS